MTVKTIVLRVKRAAEYIAVSRSTLYSRMEDGSLPYVRIGRCRRLRISDLDKFIDDRATNGGDSKTNERK